MSTEPVNLTHRILREIRDEVRRTNERLDTVNERLDSTSGRLDSTSERIETLGRDLGQRIVDSELRTATALTDLASTIREMTTVLRAQTDLRPRVERCEREIVELKVRLG